MSPDPYRFAGANAKERAINWETAMVTSGWQAVKYASIFLFGTCITTTSFAQRDAYRATAYLLKSCIRAGGGIFTSVGNMHVRRTSHTATLMPNGKVVLVGGSTPGQITTTDTIEVYDPQTRSFALAGKLLESRVGHTATLLQDGRILIVGGRRRITLPPAIVSLASAEIYDPSTQTSISTNPMGTPRYNHTADLLPDGKVLISGGLMVTVNATGNGCLRSLETFDPVTAQFTPVTSQMAHPRFGHRTINTGTKVAMFGGICTNAYDIESFDINTGTFNTFPPGSPSAQFAPAWPFSKLHGHSVNSVPTASGNTVSVGVGGGGMSSYKSAYWYSTGTTLHFASLRTERTNHSATVLADGRLLIAGGSGPVQGQNTWAARTSAEVFEFTQTMGATGSTKSTCIKMRDARSDHTATLLQDGSVLLTGGLTLRGPIDTSILNTAELFRN